jgi:hypothetical protein
MECCVGFVLKQHEGYLLRNSAQHCQSSLHDSSVFQPISPLTRDFPARLPEKEDRLKTRAMGAFPLCVKMLLYASTASHFVHSFTSLINLHLDPRATRKLQF